jgi:hypothetical protein
MHYAHQLFVVLHPAILIIGNFAGRQCLCIIYRPVIMLTMLFVVVLFLFHSFLFRGLFLIRQVLIGNIYKGFWGIPLATFRSGFPLQSSRFAGRISTSIPNAKESLHTLVASPRSHPTKPTCYNRMQAAMLQKIKPIALPIQQNKPAH